MKKTIQKIIFILIISLSLCSCFQKGGEEMIPEDGGRQEQQLSGHSDDIASRDIISFSYNGPDYIMNCDRECDLLHIVSQGGYSDRRDGTYFLLDYQTDDLSFLDVLQSLVEEHELAKDNGHIIEVSGLPEGIGDSIFVIYESGEEIYKSSNQNLTISLDTCEHIYDVFHNLALQNGFDFSSDGSNVPLYDDADEEYLQGVWLMTHFGKEYRAEFSENRVKIYCQGELTDDCEYAIYEGCIRKDQLKDGLKEAGSEYDYEEFSIISCFRKQNEFTLTAYFMKESYSTGLFYKQE